MKIDEDNCQLAAVYFQMATSASYRYEKSTKNNNYEYNGT